MRVLRRDCRPVVPDPADDAVGAVGGAAVMAMVLLRRSARAGPWRAGPRERLLVEDVLLDAALHVGDAVVDRLLADMIRSCSSLRMTSTSAVLSDGGDLEGHLVGRERLLGQVVGGHALEREVRGGDLVALQRRRDADAGRSPWRPRATRRTRGTSWRPPCASTPCSPRTRSGRRRCVVWSTSSTCGIGAMPHSTWSWRPSWPAGSRRCTRCPSAASRCPASRTSSGR